MQCPDCGSLIPEVPGRQTVDCRVCGWTLRTGLGLAGTAEDWPLPCPGCSRMVPPGTVCPDCPTHTMRKPHHARSC